MAATATTGIAADLRRRGWSSARVDKVHGRQFRAPVRRGLAAASAPALLERGSRTSSVEARLRARIRPRPWRPRPPPRRGGSRDWRARRARPGRGCRRARPGRRGRARCCRPCPSVRGRCAGRAWGRRPWARAIIALSPLATARWTSSTESAERMASATRAPTPWTEVSSRNQSRSAAVAKPTRRIESSATSISVWSTTSSPIAPSADSVRLEA